MSRPALATAAGILVFVLAVVLWPVRSTGPEPIRYGRDACARCRMPITQLGFAGELRDREGRLTTYDDLGCMLAAMVGMRREIPEAWVEDHDDGRLIPLLGAHLVRAADAGTPMDHGLVAFREAAGARRFAEAHGGVPVALEDAVRDAAHAMERAETP
jgi:copper chaperone NosL